MPYVVPNTNINKNATLAMSHNGKTLVFDSSDAQTLRIPTGLPRGFTCRIVRTGTGSLSLLTSTGVTLHNSVTFSRYKPIELQWISLNEYVVVAFEGAGGAVESVNEQTGAVVLNADDISDASTTNKFVTATEKSAWDSKQTALLNQTNIKSVNNQSLLGSGNISISGTGAWGDISGNIGDQADLQAALAAVSADATAEYLSHYDDLEAAIEAISNTTLFIDRSETVTTGVTVPETVKLAQLNDAQLTISGGGSINFEGEGLADALNARGLLKFTSSLGIEETRDFYVNLTTNAFTGDGHPFVTGQMVRYRVTQGAAASPLADGGAYYVIDVNGASYKLATSYENALAGTALDLTTNGGADAQGYFQSLPFAWSGDDYPKSVSSELIDTGNDSETDRLRFLTEAFRDKRVTFYVHPRTITSPVSTGDGQSLYFLAGEHPNTFDSAVHAGEIPFTLGSDSRFSSEAGAIIYEPNVSGGRTTAIVRTKDGASNVEIVGNHFKHSPSGVFNSSATTAAIQNANNCRIAHNWFDACRAYHAGVIVTGYTEGVGNNYDSYDNIVEHNLCTGYVTQNLFIIGGYNNTIRYNRCLLKGALMNAYSTVIDVEPNTQYDEVFNCEIVGNWIDVRDVYLENSDPIQYINTIGILIQNLYTNGIYNVKVNDNTIIGWNDEAEQPSGMMSAAIQFDGGYNIEIARNRVEGADIRTIQARKAWIHHNEINGRIILASPADHRVEDNWLQEHYLKTAGNLLGGRIVEEEEILKPFTSDGSEVSLHWQNSVHPEGDAYQYQKGLEIEFNNALHTIESISTNADDLFRRHMTLDPDIPAIGIATAPASSFDATNNEITTDANHNLETGGIVFFIQDGSSVAPTQLPTYLEYWVIKTANNKFKLATSKENALANTPIDFTTGSTSGTFQFVPVLRLRFTKTYYSRNHCNGGEKTGVGEAGYELLEDGDSQILSTFTDERVVEVADANYVCPHNAGIVVFTSLSADRTVALPDYSTIRGKTITVKDAGAVGTHSVLVGDAGAGTIDGAGSAEITEPYGSLRFKAARGGWILI